MNRLTSNTPLTEFEAMNMSITNLYARLKEYENTGLEPKEIGNLLCEAISLKKELDEYTTAKREGRLLILPCKVGDVVYFAHASWILGQPIVGTTSVDPVFFDPAVMWDFSNNRFKRRYFLTREEAEAALRGGVQND